METPRMSQKLSSYLPVILLTVGVTVIVLLGIGTGYFMASGKQAGTDAKGITSFSVDEKNKIVGLKDVNLDEKDQAEGTLVEGGINGEGTHHLKREGDESQNVYLTSSVINLDDYVDKKVRVWGDTFAAQKAGWLMDVVRLEEL